VVTLCGSLFRVKIPSEIEGECIIRKKIDWLHGVSKIPPEIKNMPISTQPQGKVIDEYFGTEDKIEIKEPIKEEKVETKMESIPLDSNSESQRQENKKEEKNEDKKEEEIEKDVSEEWFIVD